MWENSLERLKILGYEANFCKPRKSPIFSRVHFVFPGANPSHQFDDFVALCEWLIFEINRNNEMFKREDFDDPNTVVNKLMLALRQLDFKLSFPLQKLRSANGEHVCSVLEFLSEQAFLAKKLTWKNPGYVEADDVRNISHNHV